MTIKSVSPVLFPHIRPLVAGHAFVLDLADEHFAFLGVFPRSGTLKAVAWSLSAVSSPDLTLRVSVETQAAVIGTPVATSDASKTLYAANAVSADIVNPSAGLLRTEINGTTGISVTAGDRYAVVVRCISRTSGSVSVRYVQYGTADMMSYLGNSPVEILCYGYAGGAGTYYVSTPAMVLEYSDGLAPQTHNLLPNITSATTSWNSGSNPDRRAMLFKFPDYSVRVAGAWVYVDADSDIDAILYGPDGYTVVAGPYTINNLIRPANTSRSHYVPLNVSCNQNQWYRLALLPKSTTNIMSALYTYADIGAYDGMTATHEGLNVQYSVRNGAPSSGDAAWGDYDDQRMPIQLIIDGIDIPAGGSGGIYMPAPRMIGV